MHLALFVSLLAAPAAERQASQEGKVLILSSADMVANDFLSQGVEYASNARFLAQVVEGFCLDARLARIPRRAVPGGARKVSPVFEEILKEHPGPVEARYYASAAMPPDFKELRAETEAGLESLAAASGGRLSIEVIDPEAKAGQLGGESGKDYLAELGKRGISPDSDAPPDRGPKPAGRFYSAIEVRSGNGPPQVIARHHQAALLEQELAKRVLLLSRKDRPRVVFFDGRSEGTAAPAMDESGRIQTSSHSAMLKSLEDLFVVDAIDLREGHALSDAGEPISCLIVARPHDLGERQIYEIQWAVNSGIPTIFLVSPYSLDASEPGLKQSYPITPLRSGLGTLFLDWGVSLGSHLVASNVCGSLPVPRQLERNQDKVPVKKTEQSKPPAAGEKGKKETVRAPRALPVLVKAKGESLRRKHPLLAGIGELIFPATAGLTIADEDLKRAGLKATVLADSGKQSFTVRLFGLKAELKSEKTAPAGPPAVLQMKELSEPRKPTDPFTAPLPLAVLLEGKFPRRAPGLAVPPWKK
jgi:hypothetical protein